MRIAIRIAIVFSLAASAFAQTAVPDYKNPKLPIEQRVKDLLGRMTLEEKAEQIAPNFSAGIVDTTGKFNDASARKAFQQMFSVDSKISARDAAILRNAAQRFLMEKTR